MARVATMTVWDVQLGLAIHVKAPNGKYIVIDLGTGTYNTSPLRKRMWDNIAYMVITHPHLDHISDILNFDINPPKIFNTSSLLSFNPLNFSSCCNIISTLFLFKSFIKSIILLLSSFKVSSLKYLSIRPGIPSLNAIADFISFSL